jgi:hypothetical protein
MSHTPTRRQLPNRRPNETFAFDWLGMNFVATIARFDDGTVGEIFLSNGRVNSSADTSPHLSDCNSASRSTCSARPCFATREASRPARSVSRWIWSRLLTTNFKLGGFHDDRSYYRRQH